MLDAIKKGLEENSARFATNLGLGMEDLSERAFCLNLRFLAEP